jgi:hypothetical protein
MSSTVSSSSYPSYFGIRSFYHHCYYVFIVVINYLLIANSSSRCYSFTIGSRIDIHNPIQNTIVIVHNNHYHDDDNNKRPTSALHAFPNSRSNNHHNNNSQDNKHHHDRNKKKYNPIPNNNTNQKQMNSISKQSLMKTNYKQTTEEDENDFTKFTNTASSSSPSSSNRRNNLNGNNNNNNNNQNNNARKKYQQQRRQQRKKKNNFNPSSSSSSTTITDNNISFKKSSQRPMKKVLPIDLSKPFFTYHTISPPLEQTISSSPNHVISPSVLQQNEQNCIPYICGKLPITYTNDPITVDKWLCDNIMKEYGNIYSFIGFDVEAVSNLPWRETNFPNRPATVQLSTPYSSLVLQLTSNYDLDDKLLYPLQTLLQDPSIIKVGAGIDDDMLELYRWNKMLQARSRFDIGGIGSSHNGHRVGLQRLVRAIVGVELVKSKRVTMSDWSQVPLSMKQLNYASRDAWAGAAVMENLGFMYEEYMHVDVIGGMIRDVEREMVDLDFRAKERKEAKMKLKEIIKQQRQRSGTRVKNEDMNDTGYNGGDSQNDLPAWWPIVVKEEKDRLQQIIDDTAPDGLVFFPQELLGLDFSFEESMN